MGLLNKLYDMQKNNAKKEDEQEKT